MVMLKKDALYGRNADRVCEILWDRIVSKANDLRKEKRTMKLNKFARLTYRPESLISTSKLSRMYMLIIRSAKKNNKC